MRRSADFFSSRIYPPCFLSELRFAVAPCEPLTFPECFFRRLRASRVLLVGMKGLGAEVAKNLILAGVKGLTMLDHQQVRSSAGACGTAGALARSFSGEKYSRLGWNYSLLGRVRFARLRSFTPLKLGAELPPPLSLTGCPRVLRPALRSHLIFGDAC